MGRPLSCGRLRLWCVRASSKIAFESRSVRTKMQSFALCIFFGLTRLDLASWETRDSPELQRFFGDDVGHFFGEEEICSFDATYSARARQGAIEPVGPLRVEEGVRRCPDHVRRLFELLELRANRYKQIGLEREQVAAELLFADRRTDDRAEVAVDGGVGELCGMRVGSAEAFVGSGKVLVRDLWRNELVGHAGLLREVNQR